MIEAVHLAGSAQGVGAVRGPTSPGVSATPAPSTVAWAAGFFFAFRSIAVFISARWLNAGTEAGVLFTFACSAGLLTAAAVQAFGPFAQPIGWIRKVCALRWLALYLAFSGCSLLWTAAASPASSALYWCASASDVVIMLLLFRGSDTHAAAFSIMKGFVWGACILAAIAWLLPPAADLRLGDLEYFNTNQIGNLCALGIFMCMLAASRYQARWRMASVFLTISLIRSLSKATLAAFVVSQAYRLLTDRAMTRRKKVLLFTCAVVVTLAFWGLLEAYTNIYTSTGNQAETLTGRTAIWAWSFDAAMSHPWLGNGIDAMWKVAPPFGGELFEARHTENELLQQFFAYGVAGVAMLIGIYASLWRLFRRLGKVAERTVLISLLIFVVVRGVVEAEPFDLLLPLWMITTVAVCVEHSLTSNRSLLRENATSAALASEVTA